jgi:hypothetical protein
MDRSAPEVAVTKAREGGGSPAADAFMADLLAKHLAPGQVAKTAPGYQQAYERLGYAVAPRVPGGRSYLYAPGGEPGTSNFGLSPEAAALAAAGGRGGGGGFPPWLTAFLWGHAGGGGGGGGGRFGLGLTGAALGGAMGIGAGFGSLGSFAGFGPEHIILTAGGIVGSGVAAVGGGSLLAAGAAGKLGVGMGSDAAVMSSTIADTSSLYKGYEKLARAQQTYGKTSEQAKEATKELDLLLNELSNTAGVKAEAGVAKATMALNEYWDKATSGARVQASKILMQGVELAHAFVAPVNKAAEENFALQNTGLKPLMAWLKGPEGMGIFLQLENEFRNEIPTAMKALDQGFEFFAKTVAYTAPLTGAFLTKLDEFFTKWNSPTEFAVWEGEMNKLIDDFHAWDAFVKILAKDLFDLFNKDAHTGQSIIEDLTGMLVKVNEWEQSTKGSQDIKTIFSVHKEEVLALLKALSELVAPFEEIYMTLSPPLVKGVTAITEAVAKMLLAFESLGSGATWVVGIGLILTKLKLLVPLLTQAGVATGLLAGDVSGATKISDLTVAQGQKLGVVPVASKGAAAEGAAVEDGVAEEGLTGALLTDAMASAKSSLSAALPDLIKGGLVGLGTSTVASALGVHGATNTALSTGLGVGVAGSMALGPEVGIPAGLATAGLIEAIHALNKKAPEYGEQFAKAYYAPFAVILPKTVTEPLKAQLAKIRNEREKAEHPSEALGGLTHLEEKIPGYGSLFTAGPSAETSKVHAKERAEGVNAAEAFQQGFRDSTQKSAFGFSLGAFQALSKPGITAEARKAAAQTMLAYATELVQRKELPANALGEIIHQLERYFPELTATLAKQGANTSRELTAALNLKQAEANTQAALKNIDVAFGTSALTVGQALKATEYAVAHSTGAKKHYWEEELSALQHATEEQKKAVKASAAAQLESLRNLGLGLKTGVTSWETYANGVTAWSEKLSERVSDGIESLAQGISTINKMLEGELKGLGAPAEVVGALVTGKKGVTLKANPVNPSPSAGEGGPPLAGHAAGGLLQIGRPGDAGRDTVGLNVGGLPIAVAPGEQVAVFNRHQLPIVNAALAPMGGLPGLFSQVSTPNYMASGGIVAPHVSGTGAIPDIVSAGLTEVAKAANAKAGKASAASAKGGKGGGIGHYSGSWVDVMRQIAKAKGWSLSAWEGVLADESGGVVSAQNPTSTAFGLGQLENMNWPTYGGGPGSSGVEQIEAMARYISAVYGNPTAALAHENAVHWYARGGLLAGFAKGGLHAPRGKADAALSRLWGAAAPHFHMSRTSPMPTTMIVPEGATNLPLLTTEMENPSAGKPNNISVGKRKTFVPEGFLGELGLPRWAQAILFEWTHHFQRHHPTEAADRSPEGKRLAKKLGLDPAMEGGSQAWMEALAPAILAKAGFPSVQAVPEPQSPFYPAAQWLRKDYGSKWITNTQFGFARGGLVPGFASGGLLSVASSHPQKTTRGIPKKAKKLGKNKKATGLFRPVPGLKKALPDVYQQQLKELASIMERQVPQLEEEYGDANEEDTQELAKAPHAGELIITPTATEKLAGITLPWEDKPNVELRLSQLTGLEGYWTSIHEHLNSALELTNPVTAGTIKAIQERKKKIEEIRAKIKELRKKLAAKLKAIRDKITANIKEITVHEHALTALGNPTKANDAARAHLKAEINKLKGENKNLGGDETEVGTGGEIGSRTKKAETEITTLQANSAALVSQQKELEERHTMLRGDVTTIAGQSGHGGFLEQALLKHGEIAQQIVELGGTPQKLKEAILEAGSGPESALELAERQKVQLEEKLKLKTEELKVSNTALSVFGGSGDIGSGGKNAFLAAMSGGGLIPIPYAGSFDVGGVVNAPVGAARVAVVHGQEEILTPEQRKSGGSSHQTINVQTLHPGDPDTLVAIGKAATRGQRLQGSRLGSRIRPGI